jgi:hypothetical protein
MSRFAKVVRGWIMPNSHSFDEQGARMRIAQRQYSLFRVDYRLQGLDPDWIGAHEVKPVRCQCCGEAIPWNIIKGWRD